MGTTMDRPPVTGEAAPVEIAGMKLIRSLARGGFAEVFEAEQVSLGLVDHVAPHGEALARAREVAAQALAMPAAAVRMSKETINAVATALHHAAGHMAHDQIALAAASAPGFGGARS